jgi:RNA polymerase sigma factor (sigma-70 family)
VRLPLSAVEASALRAPALARRPLATPLLRLRSDEQLIALFRAGSDEAFSTIVERYRQRLFAYVRQMLSAGPRADAEDVLQDVFVRAYGALRGDSREVNLRAWLYRVAHNRCIDQLRRPVPAAGDVFEMSRRPLLDPIETAQRRDDLRRLVEDVGRLPEQQRSALLMREIDGLAYVDIACALDVTVPAVKSLLVRARVGLVEAIEARDTDCEIIRTDLLDAYDRGVKASGRARRHMRECDGCREYRVALRSMRRSFAALSPVAAAGPVAMVAKALGLGGAGGSGAAAGAGGAGALSGTLVTAKVAVVVGTAVLATGTAAEVHHLTKHHQAASHAAVLAAPASTGETVGSAALRHRVDTLMGHTKAAGRDKHAGKAKPGKTDRMAAPPVIADPRTSADATPAAQGTGGAVAPIDTAVPSVKIVPPVATPDATAVPDDGTTQDLTPASVDPDTTGGSTSPPSSGPPPEH